MSAGPTIDLDALAAKHGGTPDYDALASKYGGSSESKTEPGLMSRIGSQVGDFFSSASHAMNPENIMSQIPTSWEDLKNKWEAEKEDAQAHGRGAVEQFKQGNIGRGISTLMNADPVIGQPTGQSAEDLRQGNVGKALGNIAPYFIPSALEKSPALYDAAAQGLERAKEIPSNIKPAMAQMITDHPQLTRAATAAGSGLATGLAAHAIPGGAPIGGAYGTYLGGRYLGNIAINWAQKVKLAELGETLRDVPDDALLESQKNPPLQLKKQVRDIVGTGEGAATTRLIEDELARRQQAKGVPMFGGSPPPSPAAAAQRANPATPLWQQAGTEATPPPAPPDVNPIQALQTPSGRKPGGIQNQPTPVVSPTPAPRVSLADMLGIEASPQVSAPPVETIPGSLPSGRTPGGIQNQIAPIVAPPTPRVSLADQIGIQATPQEPIPQVNPITALRTPSGRTPGGIQNQVAEDLKPPSDTVPAYDGPSKDVIAKSLGMKGGYKNGTPQQIATIDKIYDDMVAKAARPGVVAPQAVSAPTAPTPAPVANPIAALKTPEPAQAPVTPPAEPVELTEDPMTIGTSALPHNIAPADVTVVHDTWPYEAGGRESVSLITGQGLSKLAKAEGKSPAEMRQILQADNYTIPTTQQLWQAYMSRVKEMFGLKTRDQITQKSHGLLQNDWGLERGTTPTEEQLLKSYGSVLKNHQGPMSPEHIANVTYMKAFEGQPQPVNLPPKAFSALPQVPGTQGPSLEDLLRQSLPPQP